MYCPAGFTNAFGGVENGDAKQRLAPNVTAKSMGTGLTPMLMAHFMAIGAMSTAVAVLLMNIVSNEVAKYIAASITVGWKPPNELSNEDDTHPEIPVFSKAVDIGIIAAMSMMLSQLMVLYAASTLRKHPVNTVKRPAIMTAVTGATMLNAIAAIIPIIITAATGAL